MVAAKLANMVIGDNQHVASANLQTHVSRADAAKMLNVSERTVNKAKKTEKKQGLYKGSQPTISL